MSRTEFEEQLWSEGFQRIMGLDEVGRGCLAGPVVAAGVIFKPGTEIEGIRDSKTIPEHEREQLAELIQEKALFWTVLEGSIQEIEQLNILWASLATMQKCAETKGADPDYLLVDGNRYVTSLIPYTCLVKGDDRSMSIGAASILAKVYRDSLMKELSGKYPEFGWETNVGYPTPHHKKALKEYGFTKYHRLGFSLGTEKKYSKS
ncbi:MAG: ribonuclease HII [Balneolaceae bacterium]|nr:ribonuclease HII [Balneolaceae bacterium]MBO6547627.1 ribonuclease HII [Balneolaceae bacterium]MBO6648138.1 ribonuclease HII [Balneolaceae bacterium]